MTVGPGSVNNVNNSTDTIGLSVTMAGGKVVVAQVQPGSAAAAANLAANDQIEAINRQNVFSPNDVSDALRAAASAGGKVSILVRRNGIVYVATANLANAKKDAGADGTLPGGKKGLLTPFIQKQSADILEDAHRAIAEVNTLAESVMQKAGETTDSFHQRLHGMREKVTCLEDRLADLAKNTEAALKKDLQNALDRLHQVGDAMRASAAKTEMTAQQRLDSARGRIAEIQKNLTTFADKETGEVQEQARQAVAQANALAALLKQETGETGAAFRERIDQAQKDAGALQNRLAILADQLTDPSKTDLDQAVAKVGDLRMDLAGLDVQAKEQAEKRETKPIENAQRILDGANGGSSPPAPKVRR